ncbi:MAG TPA: DUF2520 domain-containing protein [Candidatus Acidoferrales bacterium]|jgi:predicted short-subunit dehydrogenase-like oxidoreductase (DUF2520 family)|nr:DUF2520 domain-containing protein [Candidatus Acidoferrales bacterium]
MSRTVSIVGAGRVGISLAKHLREAGWRIGAVVTRSQSTARAAVRRIGAGMPVAFEDVRALVPGAKARTTSPFFAGLKPRASTRLRTFVEAKTLRAFDLILFATPDDAMPAVAQSLADALRSAAGPRALRDRVVLHTSATLDRSVLAPLAQLGAATGSLHPMQAFGGKVMPKLGGVIFGIEGDAKARRTAQSIAKSLGGIPVAIETSDKPAYHAAAVMAGGSIYPVLEAGLQLLISIGFTRQRASQTLLPLLRQIFDNIERIGPRAAWTGPLSRGDYAVVARHMKALRRYPPEFGESYAALAKLAAQVLAKDPAAMRKPLARALAEGKRPG